MLYNKIVCDNNMILTDVLAGWPGSVHDSRVLRNSTLFATSGNKFPGDYHIIGDGRYPLLRLSVPTVQIWKARQKSGKTSILV